jgi:hypothetical protein
VPYGDVTCGELAVDLSRALLAERQTTGAQLRDRASKILQAASVVIPVSAIAVSNGPPGTLIPFGVAALSYAYCAFSSARALIPQTFKHGVKGSVLLAQAKDTGASLPEMQERAAQHLDHCFERNEAVIDSVADHVERAIIGLAVEIVALAVALGVTVTG